MDNVSSSRIVEGQYRRATDNKVFVQVPITTSLLKPIAWVVLIAAVLSVALLLTNHFGVFYSKIIQDELSNIHNEASGSYKQAEARKDMHQLRITLEQEINQLRLAIISQEDKISALERELDQYLVLGQQQQQGVSDGNTK